MSKFLNQLRVSVMSVHEGWWYAYLAVLFLQMANWTGMVAWDEAAYGDHARLIEYLRAVGRGTSHMTGMFILNAIGAVELGRLTMVLAQGIADRLEERRRRFRAELIAEGIELGKARGITEGMARGKAEGKAELAAEVADWNERRLAAEARGEKFDEPPPTG